MRYCPGGGTRLEGTKMAQSGPETDVKPGTQYVPLTGTPEQQIELLTRRLAAANAELRRCETQLFAYERAMLALRRENAALEALCEQAREGHIPPAPEPQIAVLDQPGPVFVTPTRPPVDGGETPPAPPPPSAMQPAEAETPQCAACELLDAETLRTETEASLREFAQELAPEPPKEQVTQEAVVSEPTAPEATEQCAEGPQRRRKPQTRLDQLSIELMAKFDALMHPTKAQ